MPLKPLTTSLHLPVHSSGMGSTQTVRTGFPVPPVGEKRPILNPTQDTTPISVVMAVPFSAAQPRADSWRRSSCTLPSVMATGTRKSYRSGLRPLSRPFRASSSDQRRALFSSRSIIITRKRTISPVLTRPLFQCAMSTRIHRTTAAVAVGSILPQSLIRPHVVTLSETSRQPFLSFPCECRVRSAPSGPGYAIVSEPKLIDSALTSTMSVAGS